MRLVPGGKFHLDNVFQFPAYYPSLAIFKHLQPDYELDLDEVESEVKACREPYPDHGTVMFDHQAVAFNFIHCKRSSLIADAPGVGKTLPAILSIPEGGSSLVLAPASLLSAAWLAQIEQFRPELSAIIVRGNRKQREKLLDTPADVHIISYESARTHSAIKHYGSTKLSNKDKTEGPLNQFWDLIILDEAHRIKNPKSKTARMCWKLAENCDKRVALTGTPISNSPIDIWSILRFLDPDIWTSRTRFIDLFLEVHLEKVGTMQFQRIGGVHPPMQKLFDKLINFYMLRRTLEEIADPPKVIHQTRYAPMLSRQRSQYRVLKKDSQIWTDDNKDYIIDAEPLTKSMRLHQIAQAAVHLEQDDLADQGYVIKMTGDSGKIQVLKDTLKDIPDDEQIVIYTQSRQLARHALAAVKDATIIDGHTKHKDRENNLSKFIAGDNRYLIATLGALSEGVTLNNAATLIFLQRSFSFVHSVQAEARIRRINSETDTVRIIDIITEGTIDELPLKAITDKTGMFKEIIEDPRLRLEHS